MRRDGVGSPLLRVRVVVEPDEFEQDYPRRAQSGYSTRILA